MAAVDGLTTKSQLYEFDGFQSFTMSLHSKETRRCRFCMHHGTEVIAFAKLCVIGNFEETMNNLNIC